MPPKKVWPCAVITYLLFESVGLSGMVKAINPTSRSGLRYLSRKLFSLLYPIIRISSDVDIGRHAKHRMVINKLTFRCRSWVPSVRAPAPKLLHPIALVTGFLRSHRAMCHTNYGRFQASRLKYSPFVGPPITVSSFECKLHGDKAPPVFSVHSLMTTLIVFVHKCSASMEYEQACSRRIQADAHTFHPPTSTDDSLSR